MRTRDAATGHWAKIFEYYGLPPVTGKRHFKGKCPICGGVGKFRCDDKDGKGTWVCVCGSGDGMSLVLQATGKPFVQVCEEIDSLTGNSYSRPETERPSSKIMSDRQKVIRKFSRLSELRKTSGEAYLQRRGILELPDEGIRFCDKQTCNGREYQALYSLATDDKGALCYLHRTLLDGDRKADVVAAKKLMALQESSYLEYAGSVAIRMFPPAATLGIAEGIETALSCRQIYRCNVWSVMNTSFMEKFIAPPGVNHLVIFADNDTHGAGLAAAFKCGKNNILSRNDVEKVSIRWPDLPDFNDMLTEGCEARQHVLIRKQKVAEAA
ncbi:toprim domain-containing protein [Salmonella enterica]|nr:toprim domain-containing protein [Salmonella enterica]EJX4305073.1 toprim domain-containing protein [Salmonella enterica]EJX4681141.1 toprim domain-containing protein [Salmonella enterica]EJX4829997.1 toprim domain-containing protein [Salmonella enterica]